MSVFWKPLFAAARLGFFSGLSPSARAMAQPSVHENPNIERPSRGALCVARRVRGHDCVLRPDRKPPRFSAAAGQEPAEAKDDDFISLLPFLPTLLASRIFPACLPPFSLSVSVHTVDPQPRESSLFPFAPSLASLSPFSAFASAAPLPCSDASASPVASATASSQSLPRERVPQDSVEFCDEGEKPVTSSSPAKAVNDEALDALAAVVQRLLRAFLLPLGYCDDQLSQERPTGAARAALSGVLTAACSAAQTAATCAVETGERLSDLAGYYASPGSDFSTACAAALSAFVAALRTLRGDVEKDGSLGCASVLSFESESGGGTSLCPSRARRPCLRSQQSVEDPCEATADSLPPPRRRRRLDLSPFASACFHEEDLSHAGRSETAPPESVSTFRVPHFLSVASSAAFRSGSREAETQSDRRGAKRRRAASSPPPSPLVCFSLSSTPTRLRAKDGLFEDPFGVVQEASRRLAAVAALLVRSRREGADADSETSGKDGLRLEAEPTGEDAERVPRARREATTADAATEPLRRSFEPPVERDEVPFSATNERKRRRRAVALVVSPNACASPFSLTSSRSPTPLLSRTNSVSQAKFECTYSRESAQPTFQTLPLHTQLPSRHGTSSDLSTPRSGANSRSLCASPSSVSRPPLPPGGTGLAASCEFRRVSYRRNSPEFESAPSRSSSFASAAEEPPPGRDRAECSAGLSQARPSAPGVRTPRRTCGRRSSQFLGDPGTRETDAEDAEATSGEERDSPVTRRESEGSAFSPSSETPLAPPLPAGRSFFSGLLARAFSLKKDLFDGVEQQRGRFFSGSSETPETPAPQLDLPERLASRDFPPSAFPSGAADRSGTFARRPRFVRHISCSPLSAFVPRKHTDISSSPTNSLSCAPPLAHASGAPTDSQASKLPSRARAKERVALAFASDAASKRGDRACCHAGERGDREDRRFSGYDAYLAWHEDKWEEGVFDRVEVADVDIDPLQRLACSIM
ncbi:hypothetical protein TGRUB_280522 [Toxoplasma gondii RUB]|uniref:Uncharacterized protein n=1 Tax=Toxoplasma gondii RUB TaxID=935652 RepID=A0A086LL35_TOXGO|nr:hypothetical protein TGRUB_280522 [Toxoplasma gondii RUB]